MTLLMHGFTTQCHPNLVSFTFGMLYILTISVINRRHGCNLVVYKHYRVRQIEWVTLIQFEV